MNDFEKLTETEEVEYEVEEVKDTSEEEVVEEEVEDSKEEVEEEIGEEVVDEEVEEEPKFTKSQVTSMIKTRVGKMKKKLDSLGSYKKLVEDMADMTGLTPEAFKHRISSMSLQEQAKILGVDEKNVAAVMAEKKTKKATREKDDIETRLQKAEFKGKVKDFDVLEEDIDELMDENPSLTVKQAYTLVKADLGAKQPAPKKVLKKAPQKKKRIVGDTGVGSKTAGKKTVKISADIVKAAKMAGMSPVEYYQYSQMTNYDDYVKLNSKNKKE